MPMHADRSWVVSDIDTADELVDTLTNYTWTCCSGFRFGPLLFLNDATAPGKAAEYAVIIEDEDRQVESITASWADASNVRALIRSCLDYVEDPSERPIDKKVNLDIQTKDEHGTCEWCR